MVGKAGRMRKGNPPLSFTFQINIDTVTLPCNTSAFPPEDWGDPRTVLFIHSFSTNPGVGTGWHFVFAMLA